MPGFRLLVTMMLLVASLPAIAAESEAAPLHDAVIGVFESGGTSDETRSAVRDSAAGRPVTELRSGTVRMMAVSRGDADLQSFEPGYGVPMAIVAYDPVTATGFLDAALLAHLRERGVVMSERSAAMRGARRGDVVTLEAWSGGTVELPILAVVEDELIGWQELAVGASVGDELGVDRVSSMLLVGSAFVSDVLRSRLEGLPVRVTGPESTADSTDFVLPTVLVKERFGEFSFRPVDGDAIDIDDEWLDANIVDVEIEPLGAFRCHRAVVPYLRSAVADLTARGLVSEIEPADFQLAGGCFNPRYIRGVDSGFSLSRHSWGIAIDINPSSNRFDGDVALSDEFGQTFRDWGFAWGAGWLRPDGMHFEWTSVRIPEGRACSDLTMVRSTTRAAAWSVVDRTMPCG